MVKISVIIPIYNVEQYLARCLDSVVNQTYKDLEIICVNDCSPDNSGKILEWYAKKDNRIKVISRDKNGGLSTARNTGLDAASCEYIYFIDSDDWIDPDYIETMYCAAQESKAEAVLNTSMCLHYENEPQNTHFRKGHNNYSHCFVDANEAILKVNWNTVLHFWKKSFLDKIHARFPEGYFIEDIYFQAVTYIYLHKIYVIRESSYHYWIRKTGIMGSVSEDIFRAFPVNLTNFLQGKNFISAVHFSKSRKLDIRETTSSPSVASLLSICVIAHSSQTQTTSSPSVAEKVSSPAPLYKTF
mgnify:CR=1 FL=1